MTEILDAKATYPLRGGPCFSLKHRIQRLIWNIVWGLFASWTPPPLHRYRVAILRLFGAKVAWSAHVYSSARIWFPPNLTMGEHSCLGPRVNCYSMASITLKKYAVTSQGAHLCTGMHDIEDPDFQLSAKPIVLEERAWVAAEAFVGPGVTIHQGAVLGARGVLFKDAEAYGVYVGNPAQLVRYRRHPIEITTTTE
jgi:putative colanic acid biosynthesis acetyltransferase WcaF